MNLKNEKDRKSFCSVLLLALALVLLGGAAQQLVKLFGADSKDLGLTKKVLAQIKPDAEKTQKYLQDYKKAATELTAQNMFVPPPDVTEPTADCTAIFGDEAFIDNRWVKIGDRVGDAEIVALGPTSVTLLWQNREIMRAPYLRLEENSNNRSSSNPRAQNTQFNRGQRGPGGAQMRGGRGADMMMGGRGGNMGGGSGNMGGGRGNMGGGPGNMGGGRGGRGGRE